MDKVQVPITWGADYQKLVGTVTITDETFLKALRDTEIDLDFSRGVYWSDGEDNKLVVFHVTPRPSVPNN